MKQQDFSIDDEEVVPQTGVSSVELSRSPSQLWAWTIFLTGILYYCFAYLLRVYPSVMELPLRQHFAITASGFGLLTSFYYFAYAPMQLPVGVLVDRIGPRRSLIFASLIGTLGAFIFAHFQLFSAALGGRFLVGLGAAFAYVTALKLASTWLPRKYFATATGAVTGCGMVAAIFTDIYLTHSIKTDGFHFALFLPVFIGIAMIAVVFLVVKDRPDDTPHQEADEEEASALSYRQLGEYLLQIVRNPQMWIIGIVGALLYLPSSVFLDVWAIPYLQHVYHFTPEQAALGVSVMLGGWVCSSFSTGALSDIFRTRKIPLVIASFTATIIACLLLFTHSLPVYLVFTLLFLFGVCCGPHPLCFTMSKENNPHRISGTAIAFANFLIMMGGFVFQPIVGDILDGLWSGGMLHGIRIYTEHEYIMALSIIPIGLLLSGILTLLLRETYHR